MSTDPITQLAAKHAREFNAGYKICVHGNDDCKICIPALTEAIAAALREQREQLADKTVELITGRNMKGGRFSTTLDAIRVAVHEAAGAATADLPPETK